jgi:hypothetical protein
MARGTVARGKKRVLDLLAELKAAAVRVGYWVREEKLLHDVGYRPRSGGCRLRERRLILLDRDASPAAQLDTLVEILASEPLVDAELSEEARRLIARARRPVSARAGAAA